MIREELSPVFKLKPCPGTFGIEIETEAASYEECYPGYFLSGTVFNTPQGEKAGYIIPRMSYWEGHEDGSLRDFGVEYVLKEPLSFEETLLSLDQFKVQTKNVKFNQGGAGTSVHVHINMGKETFLTLGNFLTLYTLFENILVEFSGPHRRSNLFALPTRCAEKTFQNIVKMFNGIDKGDYYACSFNIEHVKYASLNLAPLGYFGSIEIRCFRGTTDADEIAEWIRVLNRMVEFSKLPGLTPRVILLEWRDKGIEFFDEVFGDESKALRKVLTYRDQPLQEMVDYNLWYVAEIARSVQDWNTISTKLSEAQKARKEKDKEAKMKVKKLVAGEKVFPLDAQLGVDFMNQLAAQVNPAPPPNHNWIIQDEVAGGVVDALWNAAQPNLVGGEPEGDF